MRCCLLLAALAAQGAAKRGITPEDYLAFQFIGDPHISPDGNNVAYVLTTIDAKKNHRVSSIWLVPTDGSTAPRRLSEEGFNSSSPRWRPDGKDAGVHFDAKCGRSSRAMQQTRRRAQIYLMSMNGGEAQTLTHLKNGAQRVSVVARRQATCRA